MDCVAASGPREVLLVVTRRWKDVARIVGFFLLFGIATSFLVIQPSYTSVAVFLPPKDAQTSKPMGSGLCTALLNSQSLDDHIVRTLQLQTVWKRRSLTDARDALKREVQIEASNSDLIKVTVRDHNAKMASDIANEYLKELNALNTRLAESDAAYRYRFLSQQAEREKRELREAEDHLQEVQHSTGLINPSKQVVQTVLSVAQLHATIAARTLDLESMQRYASETSPSVLQLRAIIAELKRQLTDRQNSGEFHAVGEVQIPANRMADVVLQQRRAIREVTLHTNQSVQVTLQRAQARINMAKAAPPVPVVDQPIVADYKSGPQRLLFWLASCWAGLLAACLYIFLGQALELNGYQADDFLRFLRREGDSHGAATTS